MPTIMKLTGVGAAFALLEKESKEEQLKLSEKEVAVMLTELKDATPVDTGKARDSWSKELTKIGYDVENSVDYIDKLNAGTSKQAPRRFIEHIALQYGHPVGTIVEEKK